MGIGIRPYLLGHDFTIHTDIQSLRYLVDQRITTLLQQKWLAKLLGYNYSVMYKKGIENKVADGLSKVYEEEGSCSMITQVQPKWVGEFVRCTIYQCICIRSRARVPF